MRCERQRIIFISILCASHRLIRIKFHVSQHEARCRYTQIYHDILHIPGIRNPKRTYEIFNFGNENFHINLKYEKWEARTENLIVHCFSLVPIAMKFTKRCPQAKSNSATKSKYLHKLNMQKRNQLESKASLLLYKVPNLICKFISYGERIYITHIIACKHAMKSRRVLQFSFRGESKARERFYYCDANRKPLALWHSKDMPLFVFSWIVDASESKYRAMTWTTVTYGK